MSDFLNERRLSFSALAADQGVHVCTVWRWAQRGVRGVVLETFAIGGRRFTTAEAFARFVAETTAIAQGDAAPGPAARTNRQRETGIERAERELRGYGI